MSRKITASDRLSSLASLATSMGIVGTSVTANKFLIGHIPIMLASGIRFVLAAGFLLVIVRLIEDGLPKIPLHFHIVFAAQALFGIFAFNVLILIGLDITTAMISGIITAATPAVIAMMSFALGDRLSWITWMGVTIAIGGVMFVNLLATPPEDEARRPLLGGFLVFLAVIGEAAYTVLGRYTARKVSPFATSTYICVYGATMFMPFALWDLRGFDLRTVPSGTWVAIGYLATFVTVVAVVLWFRGLATVPSGIAGAFTGMIPITAVMSAALLLDEEITWLHVAGIVFVLLGIFLVANGHSTPRGETSSISDLMS